jgi:pimeloyl-ACP methyl ester carboxylesterase/DNA-binding winged helix-turn-helix (wHTH) protein
MPVTGPKLLRFGEFALDLQRCVLRRGDAPIELRPKAFDVLRYLIENRDRVIGKDELIHAVWLGQAVTDDALVQCVRSVRQALSDKDHRIIRTIPRRGYLFSMEPAETPAPAPESGPEHQEVQYCRTRDGVRLAISTIGRGTPVVRAPTWFNHLEFDWHVQFRGALYRFLAERMQLIRYDGRGSGLSDRYVQEMSFAAWEHDLEAVVEALDLERYVLLGISQGGAIAIAHAVRHPERVSRLVLNGAYARGRNKRGSTRDHETGQAYLTLMRHGWGDEHSAFLRTFSMLYFPSASVEELRRLAQLQRMTMSAETAVKLRLVCDDIDVADLLPRVAVPTLILHSRHDNAVPFEEGQRLAAAIPNARFVPLESENHVPMPHEPAWPKFIAEIEAFLRMD